MMEFGKESWRTFEEGIRREWLLTNGIGGFASSTVIGANTRRYHGLLLASLKPPVQRHLILSKLDESITVGNRAYNLYSNRTPDHTSEGFRHLQRFISGLLPTFIFTVEDVFLEKKIALVHGQNTVCILYKVNCGGEPCVLRLAPLVNFRDYHHNSSRAHMRFSQSEYEGGTWITPYDLDLKINICCDSGSYIRQDGNWFMHMDYPMEQERGLHSIEDHYIPGYFEIHVHPYEEKFISVIATIEDALEVSDGRVLIQQEESRIKKLIADAGYRDEFASALVRAADDFIVYRKSTNAKTIIAGYPWFTDWGRDTMVALPGLTLVTRRFEDARQILYTFSKYVKDGLIPNMFPDEGQEPVYNSVDAPLWYFEAVEKFLKYTDDYAFIQQNIFASLESIIGAFTDGTKYAITMEKDGLISAGNEHTQLTWMDAKVGDWVVTPRQGKAVEINALWYNALMVMAHLSEAFGGGRKRYADLARRVKEAFLQTFWNEKGQCLYDVVNGSSRDGRVRPNQIFSVSLSYPVLEGKEAQLVVRKVWKELYATYGLRSLSPFHEGYVGVYAGDQYRRDGAYHQGTVWAWPIGHFITALRKVFDEEEPFRKMTMKLIAPFKDHLRDACIGSISEIFDGDAPHFPRGCFAQAWSVAEVLRAYIEDVCHGTSG